MLVGGFFIRKATIHGIWIWLYWISFIQWTWSAGSGFWRLARGD